MVQEDTRQRFACQLFRESGISATISLSLEDHLALYSPRKNQGSVEN